MAYPPRELWRRAPGRAQCDRARHLQREYLGRADESVDGDVHRRTRGRAATGSAADDLRWARRRLAGTFANFIGEVRGMEFARIDFHVDDDLASWRAEIPGKVKSSAEALGGPTTPPGKRVQVHNAGGCETGPGGVATYGKATADMADAFGFKWDRTRALEQAHRIRLVGPRWLRISESLRVSESRRQRASSPW